jgi:TIR domain-containing protein/pentapeptide repeat protein
MANEEHLARLRQGVAAWNYWRNSNPDITPDLREADLHGADLHRAILHGAILANADLIEAALSGAELYMADLSGALLIRAFLIRAHLSGAKLTGADLSGAELTGARFHGATIGWTIWGNVDLRAARGLETALHRTPSTIGIDTLYRSQGKIPETFLRGAGVPDAMIAYSKSLVEQPFQYYSCFISYSSRDEALAQRLHADLQDKGVRCWFAPEDLKIGDEFRSRIDESIQVYDRLLLILSEHSVKSRWVQKEVETAFEREGKENRTILFPIRIDEAVMQSLVGWAADIRRMRHIGDFRQWKDYGAYQQAFNRLLHDLKADI